MNPNARSPRAHSPHAALALALLATSACGRQSAAPTNAAASPVDARAVASNTSADAGSAARDAATVATVRDAAPSFTPPTQIVALGTWVPVRREPRRDAQLIGYMRAGAVASVTGMPAGRETCPVHRDHPEGGWYRLTGGGFMCVGGALAVPAPARGFRRPAQPALDAGMPYTYAINYGRALMYRSLPTMDEIRLYEPWRFRSEDAGAPAEPASEPSGTETQATGGSTSAATTTASATASSTSPNPERNARDRGTTTTASATSSSTAATSTSETEPTGEPRLRDLRGDRNTPVIRRLLTGMYVALDRTVLNNHTGDRYWRTQSGGFVRTGPLSELHHTPTFTGVELDGTTHRLPFAFNVSLHGWTYRVSANGRSVSSHRRMDRQVPIQLTEDPPIVQGERTFYRTADGFAVHDANVRIARLRPVPEEARPGERWLDVDLDQQILVAYEGERPVFVTLVSTGRRSDRDPERNYETPAGRFRIRGKHVTTTMDGDTAADGPYSIEDVPWAMYFEGSYALHGAFWHGNYGWRMSHGCVNLSPPDARRVFFWTEPQLPEGWHGVFATDEHPGTLIVLHHGDTPAPRMRPARPN